MRLRSRFLSYGARSAAKLCGFRRNLQVNLLEDRLVPSATLPRGVYPTTGVPTQFPDLVAAAPTPAYAFDTAGLRTGAVKTRIDNQLVALLPDSKFVGPRQQENSLLVINNAGGVLVRITGPDMLALMPQLTALGYIEVAGRYEYHFSEGWLPIAAMPQAERLAGLGGIVPAGQFTTNAGTVTSEANFVMQTDFVQQQFGTGAGSRVGVISDSFDALGGASIGLANGDLGPVMVIQDDLSKDGSGNPNGTDEGRGMLELVHDIAPGAGLAFATGDFGEANFAANIAKLADVNQGNTNVIVDDLTYFAEPFYQHGVIAQAITAAYNGGKHYFSSAGNFADQAFERINPTFTDDVSLTNALDFDTGPGVDTRQRLTVGPGQSIDITMQWDQPFYTTNGVTTDLDIYLYGSGGGLITAGVSNNITSQIPSEGITFSNTTGASIAVDVLIRIASGPTPGRVKWINYGSNRGGNVTINEFATSSSTVTPHAAISSADGVAATPWTDITGKEGFTSKRGNVTLFSPNGLTRYSSPVSENGPYLTAPDGTKTSFFGNASNNFFGTSAAAPHAAAVSAIIRGLRPNLSVDAVSGQMATYTDQRTSTIGDYAVHGMIRAYDAIAALQAAPRVQPLGVVDGFESGTLQPYFSLRTSKGAQVHITGDYGPETGSYHAVLNGHSYGGALGELDLHVNAAGAKNLSLFFSEKRVTAISAPEMSATFTNSNYSTGVAFSVDGVNWSRLINLSGVSQATYQTWQFDLVAAAAAAGVALSSDTRIRFQNGDGQIIAFDNIRIVRGGTIFGRMINDTNGNGVDNGEPPLPGKTLFLDNNNNGKFDRGNVNYYLGGSVSIPDNSVLVESTIAVGGFGANFQLVDVDVGVTITHPYTSDLDLYLVNPIGTKVQLFNRYGGSGDNIVADFDDSAITPIANGFGNFTGRYRPAQPLSTFTTGINPSFINGNWKLQAIDRASGDVGTLNNWILFLTVDPRFTANPNVAIADFVRTTSNITVSGVNGPINNVDVDINLNHTYVGDLEIDLVAPNGARATIFQRHGGSGDNLTSTKFDDSAAISISAGSAPFIGSFRPFTPLTTFNGLNGNGTWTLEVRDRGKNDTGSLTNWTITVGTGEEYTATDSNGDYSFTNQKGFSILNSVPEIGYRPINPGFGVPLYFDLAPNGAGVGNFYRQPDSVIPTVTNLVSSGLNPTNANLVDYVITFSEPVFGLSLNNFVLTSNLPGSFLSSITPLNSTQYVVTVNTGTGNGQVSLDFRNGINLTDQGYNSVAPSAFGNTITLDRTPPVLQSITSTSPDKIYTTGQSVNVTLNFSEAFSLVGTLNVTLDSGGMVSIAGPQSGTTLSGAYVIGAGQTSNDLTVTAVALTSGSTLRDAATNNAVLTLPGSNLDANSNIVINPGTVSYVVLNANDSGPGSLRQAIINANNNAGANTITFDPTFFSTPRTITLTSAQLDITDAVMINGPGASFATVSGGGILRVFNTAPAPGATAITLSGLTIANGKASFGAAVQSVDESVTLNNCALIGNSANVSGGAIYIGTGSLILQNSTISNNSAAGSSGRGGGGIYSSGSTLTILNCTISSNTVTGAGNDGGGIYRNSSTIAPIVIRNSTISGNSTTRAGGGIGTDYGFFGTITIQNSTITGNSASSGGGIDQNGYFANVQMESTIVFGNTAPTGPELRSSASINATASLVGSTSGAFNFTGDTFTNANIGVNPQLGPLANNGGPTLTHALSPASPAVNKGTNPAGLTTDQRGAGFDRAFSGGVDIGAVEAPINPFAVFNANDSGAGSLRQAIANANSNGGVDTIIFDPIFFSTPRTITLMSELNITEAVTIAGPGALLVTVNGNNTVRVFNTFTAPAAAAISFTGLTIANGKASNGAGVQMGDESVTLTNCVVTNNVAIARGGAIYLGTGTLTLQSSTISNNSAGGTSGQGGGGIYAGGGTLNVQNCTISNNVVTGAGNDGGGIYVTTFSAAPINILNSTISGNSATNAGGGIAAADVFAGQITIQNSTITGNSSASGGGIDQNGYFASMQMESTIVFGNMAGNGPDLRSSAAINATACLVGSNAGTSKFSGDAFTISNIGVNPQLGPLANNGGPTMTHALSGTSPAINRGVNLAGLTTDQRGAGFDRDISGGVDIGAVEAPFDPFYVFNALDSGTGSLRQAILNANSNAGAETITFDPAFFSTPRTITVGIGQMVLTDTAGTTTIAGPGINLLTISGNNLYRAFQVNSGATVAINGISFTAGNSLNGGAIQNSGTTTVSNSRFTNNQSDNGGAIFNVGALSVSNSTFDNNSANSGNGWGGAIINGTTIGVTTIASCTFTSNHASVLGGALIGFSYNITDSTFANNASGLNGGAIRTDGTVVITGSTFSGNTAANDGGAIMSHGSTTITNSTLANNTASIGGGIYFFEGAGTMRNVTVAYNTSTNMAGNIGGGTQVGTAATVTAVNIIVAGNTAASGLDAGGSFTASSSNNVLNLPAAAAGLGTLAGNGGPTQTIALLPGSPALNAGTSVGVPTTDQRGLPRVGITDIGAFEEQTPVPPAKVSDVLVNNGAVQRSRVTELKVTFSSTVTFIGMPEAAFTLLRQSDNAPVTLSAAIDNSGPGTVVTLSFIGGAVNSGSLADGRYNLTVLANQIGGDGLDGDGNGTSGDNYMLVGDPVAAPKLFRLFGDANGDGTVTAADFNAFRVAYGTTGPSIFDFNGDNQVSASDFNDFRTRYGLTLVP